MQEVLEKEAIGSGGFGADARSPDQSKRGLVGILVREWPD